MADKAASLIARCGVLLDDLRATRPLVQCITNFVSMDVAANALLALGASPAMVHAPEESPEFIRLAGALVCNIGTLSQPWIESMTTAATAAHAQGKPWVLDPVGAGATQFRDDAIRQLLRHRPTVIRGNATEIIAVARAAGLTQTVATPHGVDTAHSTDEALSHATALARHCLCVVAATGPVDIVTDGKQVARIVNGSPLMARVTALGCALSGIVGACLSVSDDAFEATVAALGLFAVAGELADADMEPTGPGTFRVRLLDRLDDLSPQVLSSRMKVTA